MTAAALASEWLLRVSADYSSHDSHYVLQAVTSSTRSATYLGVPPDVWPPQPGVGLACQPGVAVLRAPFVAGSMPRGGVHAECSGWRPGRVVAVSRSGMDGDVPAAPAGLGRLALQAAPDLVDRHRGAHRLAVRPVRRVPSWPPSPPPPRGQEHHHHRDSGPQPQQRHPQQRRRVADGYRPPRPPAPATVRSARCPLGRCTPIDPGGDDGWVVGGGGRSPRGGEGGRPCHLTDIRWKRFVHGSGTAK